MKVHLIIVDDNLTEVRDALDGVSEFRNSSTVGVQVSVVTPTILDGESRDELSAKAGANATIHSPTSLPKDASNPFSSEPRQDMSAASRHPLPEYVASLARPLPVAILWDNRLYNEGNSDLGFTADLAIACAGKLPPGSVLRLVTSAKSKGGAFWPANQDVNPIIVQQELKGAGVEFVNSDRRTAVGELLREFVRRQDGDRTVHAFAWRDGRAEREFKNAGWERVSGVEPIRSYVAGLRAQSANASVETNPEDLQVFKTTRTECLRLASRERYWYLDLETRVLSAPDGRCLAVPKSEAYWLVWAAFRRLRRGPPLFELCGHLNKSDTAYYEPLNKLKDRAKSDLGVDLFDEHYNVPKAIELVVCGRPPG